MKNKLTVKNAQGEYLQHVVFEEQQVQDDFIAMLASTHAWGKPEHQVVVTEAVYDEETGEILEEAVYETVPAEYTIEIEDIAAQVDQERINHEEQEYLNSTDWYVIREIEEGTTYPEEIKIRRALARARIVKDAIL